MGEPEQRPLYAYLWRGGPIVSRREGGAVRALLAALSRRKPARPWRAPADDPWRALRSVADFEECARAAAPVGSRVRVRAAANDPKMPLGAVEVRVRGPWRRRLTKAERGRVHAALVEHAPVMLKLEVKS